MFLLILQLEDRESIELSSKMSSEMSSEMSYEIKCDEEGSTG